MMRASLVSPALDRFRQYSTAARMGAKVPRRWTRMTASHSSTVMLTSIRSRRMPALLTRTSRPPKVSTAVAISRCAPSTSETSSPLATASPPMALISSTTSPAGPLGPTAAVHLGPEVVDHDLGTLAGELDGVGPADATARRR